MSKWGQTPGSDPMIPMNKIIQKGLVFLVFAVPLVFSHATTEVYGLVKWSLLELGVFVLLVLWAVDRLSNLGTAPPVLRGSPLGLLRISSLRGQSLCIAVLAFLAVSAISLVKAVNKYEGLTCLYQLAAGVGLFFLIANNVKNKKEANELIAAIVLSGVAACFFSLYKIHGIKLSVSRLAYTSTFGNPIFFAQYLTLAIPLSLSLCLASEVRGGEGAVSGRKRMLSSLFFGLSALLMLVFVLITRSRGAYLGLFAIFLYGYIRLLRRSSKRLKVGLIGMLVASFFVLALGLIFSRAENIRFRNLMRVYVWKATLSMVKDNPVLGVGTGNFKVIYPLYRTQEEKEVTPKGVTYSKAHNDFLQVWAEGGTLGLACFLWILFAAFRRRALNPGISAAMIAVLLQAFFNPMLYVPTSAMGFWVLLGLIALKE